MMREGRVGEREKELEIDTEAEPVSVLCRTTNEQFYRSSVQREGY